MTQIDVSGMRDAVRQRYREVIDDAFTALLVEMEADAPRDSGLMTSSIEVAENDSDVRFERTIRAPREYSSWQDEGVEGPIVAKNAKALHFFLKDGTEIFVKSTKGVPRTGWWSDKVARLGDFLQNAMR